MTDPVTHLYQVLEPRFSDLQESILFPHISLFQKQQQQQDTKNK